MFVCSPAGLGAQFLNSVSYYILILKCPVPIDSGSYTLKAALFHTIPLWCCKQCNRQEDAWEWENLGISLLLKVLTAVFYKSEGAWQVKGEGNYERYCIDQNVTYSIRWQWRTEDCFFSLLATENMHFQHINEVYATIAIWTIIKLVLEM